MTYNILCAGCSFTDGNFRKFAKSDWAASHSYANFLPGKTHNIGSAGFGISPKLFRTFFNEHKEEKLTHVVYQVPSPSRQPIDLDDYNEDNLGQHWRCFIFKHKSQKREFNIQVFDKKDQYLKKSIGMVDINVKLIQKKQPNAKIIFLRYEDTRRPLLYEFTKDFYKTMLADYCKKNDIPYIYEENFHTQWFYTNKYGIHPNKVGAKLIADKIKEYL